MTRSDRQRLDDILTAAETIGAHLARGTLADGLVYDAVRMRLIEIGEAVKDIAPELLASEPDVPWQDIAGMRDRLAHHYFDTDHALVTAAVESDLPLLVTAVERLRTTGASPA